MLQIVFCVYGFIFCLVMEDRVWTVYQVSASLSLSLSSLSLALVFAASYLTSLNRVVVPWRGVAWRGVAWRGVQVIVWRCIHWLGMGSVLWAQGKFQFYTQHFTNRGRTLYEAFGHWKALYNGSLTMNVVVFVGCFWRYCPPLLTWTGLTDPYVMACRLFGVCLILISAWSAASCYDAGPHPPATRHSA